MPQREHIRGPYDEGCAGDEAFQLAFYECTIADLIALAAERNVKASHILSSITKGTRPQGKTTSMRMGGRTWRWGLSLNGGQPGARFSRNNPQLRVRIVNVTHS